MIRSHLDTAFTTRDGWRRRRRHGRMVSFAGWALTAVAVCWLLLIAVAGFYPPA